MTLARLLARRHRWLIGTWTLLLWALCGATTWAYQSTYATDAERLAAVASVQRNGAAVVLYGRLPTGASPAVMFAWEMGAYATVLAAVMGVLLAVALTRAAEDDGTTELVRSTGLAPRAPLVAAGGVLAAVALALAAGCAAATGIWSGHVDGVTWPGALTFGAVVGVTFASAAAAATLVAQVLPTAGGARVVGLAWVGACVAMRAVADRYEVAWLTALSPLGLRATVRPFAADRWWVLALAVAGLVPWAALALIARGRREHGAGLVRRRDHRDSRLPIRGTAALAVRLDRGSVAAWTVTLAVIAGVFTALGSTAVEHQRTTGDVDGFLGAQLGTADPTAGFLRFVGVVLGILAALFAVLSVLRARREEVTGLTDAVLATGVARRRPLAGRAAVTAAAVAVILGVAAAVSAATAAVVFDGAPAARMAVGAVAGQWPAALAVGGGAALLAGALPRLTGLAWLPLGAGAVLTLLGTLLGVPAGWQRLSVFAQAPHLGAGTLHPVGAVVLLAVAAACTAVGLAAIARRDVGRP